MMSFFFSDGEIGAVRGRGMTLYLWGGLAGVCVQLAMKCGLCPASLKDRVGK